MMQNTRFEGDKRERKGKESLISIFNNRIDIKFQISSCHAEGELLLAFVMRNPFSATSNNPLYFCRCSL